MKTLHSINRRTVIQGGAALLAAPALLIAGRAMAVRFTMRTVLRGLRTKIIM